MLDKLIDFLLNMIDQANPIYFVKEYQECILLRCGKYKAVLKPGAHLKIPFIDEPIRQCVIWSTLNVPSQSLVTVDSKAVVVKALITYKIVNSRDFYLNVFGAKEAMSDIVQSVVKSAIINKEWKDVIKDELDNEITKESNNQVSKWGIEIGKVTLTDIAQMRSIKLINENN